ATGNIATYTGSGRDAGLRLYDFCRRPGREVRSRGAGSSGEFSRAASVNHPGPTKGTESRAHWRSSRNERQSSVPRGKAGGSAVAEAGRFYEGADRRSDADRGHSEPARTSTGRGLSATEPSAIRGDGCGHRRGSRYIPGRVLADANRIAA